MTPAVTVCIPVFNGMPYLSEAVGSVLEQSLRDWRLAVLDNCSTDGSADWVEAIRDPRVRLARHETNIGAAANWNAALQESEGRYFKLLCADDRLHPECLEQQVAALEAHPLAVMAAAKRDVIDSTGKVQFRNRGLAGLSGEIEGSAAVRRAVRSGTNPFGEPSAVLMRGDVLHKAGEWDGSMRYLIDLDYYSRVLDHGTLVAVPQALCDFRLQAGSWSTALSRQQALDYERWVRTLRGRDPSRVSGVDAFIGIQRAKLMALARRLVYRRLAFGTAEA